MANSKKYTAKQIIDALTESNGYVGKAASLLGCTTQTIYNYRDEYITVRNAWDDIRQRRHDDVETALHNRIDKGDTTAIIFYLKTQAKDRGYVERQEIENSGNVEVVITRAKDHNIT